MKKFTKKLNLNLNPHLKQLIDFAKSDKKKIMKNKFLIIVSSILATMIVLVTTLIGYFI